MVKRIDPACALDNPSLSFDGACAGGVFDTITEFCVLSSKQPIAVSQI
jgi:hypothetical protein